MVHEINRVNTDIDTLARTEFCHNIEQNFSVTAPAGVGKTYAIIERIRSLSQQKPTWLSFLHVVTYTRKAAETLKQRALEALPNSKLLMPSFFGTIHSLCHHYIQKFRSFTRLPDNWSIYESNEPLLFHFLRTLAVDHFQNDIQMQQVLQHLELETLVCLAAQMPLSKLQKSTQVFENTAYPDLDLELLLNYGTDNRNRESVRRNKEIIWQWQSGQKQKRFIPIPMCNGGGQAFQKTFKESFEPLTRWLSIQAFSCVQKLANLFYHFRIERGQLTHEDLIQIFEDLLQTEAVRTYFHIHPIYLLLDEAQDTDAQQFKLILELIKFNVNNHFSMVGDPQQSIYSSRTNVQNYLKIQADLQKVGFLKTLIFSKTFRCPSTVVRYINKTFPRVLNSKIDPKQVDFVPLQSVNYAETGTVEKLFLPPIKDNESLNKIEYECNFLSTYLKNFIQKGGFAPSDICVLCPRNAWLQEMQFYFDKNGLRLQLHSGRQTWQDQALYDGLISLVSILAYPEDAFEIVGFLRACLQIPESIITEFFQEKKYFQILDPTPGEGPIEKALTALNQLRKEFIKKPLYEGSHLLIQVSQSWPLKNLNSSALGYIQKTLLQTSIECVQSGGDLFDFLRRLKISLGTVFNEPQSIVPEAIQGYSCHKSKGLEWPIVLLPFLQRPLYPKTEHYPYIASKKVILNADSPYISDEEAERKRELQRLFYVSCTRVKQSLLLVNDKALWPSHSKFTLADEI